MSDMGVSEPSDEIYDVHPKVMTDEPPRARGGGWEMSLLRIENKIDLVLANHHARITRLESESKDHAIRLRQVEVTPVVRPTHLLTTIGIVTPFVILVATLLK